MAIVNSIHTLKATGKSARQIARLLGIDRKTVLRHLEKGPNPPPGSEPGQPPGEFQKGPNVTPGSEGAILPPAEPLGSVLARIYRAGPQSLALPYLEVIIQGLEDGKHAKSIYYDLVRLHGFRGSYESIKRLVRRLRKVNPQWVPRLVYPIGEAAQVDFGAVRVLAGGKEGRKRMAKLFVMTLCHSRKAYVEAVADESIETFIECHVRAFAYFGGVPLCVIPDNLKAAVIKACWEDPVLNRVYQAFAKHYDFAVLPCRTASPEEKGIVESGVKYVKGYLKGRCFANLDELNAWLDMWEKDIAGTRIHGTTKRQVNEAFAEEQKHLRKPPAEPFEIFRAETRTVYTDGFIQVGARFYEVPPAYLGKKVIVHIHPRVIRVFDGERQVVMHARGAGKGARALGMWPPPREVPKSQRELEAWVKRDAQRVGPFLQAYVTTAIEAKGRIVYRMLHGILGQRDRYDREIIETVAARLLATHTFDGKIFRESCKELHDAQLPPLKQEDEIIRPLTQYCLAFLTDSQPAQGDIP